MATFDPRLYGARWADDYDEWHTGLMDDKGAVDALSSLAGGGPVLEFGAGTGRLTVPLAERGLDVVGVDISTDMLAKLRAKSSAVTTVEADMTTVRLEREFAVAFIAFNSVFVLGTQRQQVDLFRNAAAHLRPGGRFVLETVVIRSQGDDGRGSVAVVNVGTDSLTLAAGTVDPVTALYTGTWVVFEPNGTRFYPMDGRHVTHHEMDLMAELAGLSLEHRWSDWKGGTFDKDSKLHISIYQKPV